MGKSDIIGILVLAVVILIIVFVLNLVFGILAWVLSHFWFCLIAAIVLWYIFRKKKSKGH